MAAPPAGAGRRRRSSSPRRRDPDATRADLLAAGRRLVTEQALGEVLGHLRVADLARAAGVTAGAFYHYWDGQDAYRAEVAAALLAGPRADAAPRLTGLDDPATVDDRPAWLAAVAAVVAAAGADDTRVKLALWAHDDPAVNARLAQRRAHARAAWAHGLGTTLAAWGRRPADGWSVADLADAALALQDGLHLAALATPDRADTLPGTVAQLLALGATEAGPPAPVPVAPPAPTTPTPDDNPRRRRLLQAGVEAARAQPTGDALDHIRADDVVADLDLTIGAFFHHWPTQDDYRDDLLDDLFAAERYVDPTAVAVRADLPAAGGLDEAVRVATTWYWSVAADHPDNRLHLAFLALDDPYVTEHLLAEATVLAASWEAVLAALLEAAGRRVRPPLGIADVVAGISAALDGFILRRAVDPSGLDPDDDGWTRWGRTSLALLRAATAGTDDDRDLATLAHQELTSS